jgi:hypothetical protein
MTRVQNRMSVTILLLVASGCVQRTLTVQTDPPGALVSLNDQEIGRTPVTRNFTWYGVYDVEVRMAGYQSIKTTSPVIAPWWQWIPMDFFAEFLPLTDHHDLMFTLHPPDEQSNESDLLVRRAEQLGSELENTRKTTTQPLKTGKHEKKPATTTAPTTQK